MNRLIVLAAAAAALMTPAAASAACGEHPWCDTSLSPDDRAALVLGEMTLPEKLDLLWGDEQFGVANLGGGLFHTGKNYGNVRLGIPDLNFSDGPVGPRQGDASTAMPAPIGLAASFDPALAREAGGLVADEVKAKGNDVVFAPTVNIMRTPRGGRTFEGYGEDPFLAGGTAVGWIRGAQAHGVIAEAKHYAANNQEQDRMTINEIVDERTLREIYLPQFEAAVKRGHSGAIMCAYNQVNGQFACENRHLLTDVLKGDWGFKGFVITDYPAGHDTAASLKNGLDFEPFGVAYNPASTAAAVLAGTATEADVDDHVRRILRTMFAFGVFDRDPYPNDPSTIPVDAHADLAARVEEGGITLLKNRGGLLPLSVQRTPKIAVIGSDADRYKSGGGSSFINPLKLTTPLAGIMARASGAQIVFDSSDDPAHSAATAAAADVAIVVASDTESEGTDQPCIKIDCTDDKVLTGLLTSETHERNTDAVVDAVTKAQPNSVVLLMTAGPVATDWRASARSIVEAWYPGESGGTAIARVLFGDVDPGGRLPATFPDKQSDLATEGDPEAYPGVDGTVKYKEGVLVGYRWFDAKKIKPAFPFGFGLSYTHFKYSGLRRRGNRVSVRVRNVGKRTGYAVPQLYVGVRAPKGLTQPPRQLKGYRKISLAPGKSRRVTFKLNKRSFSYWDTAANGWKIAPGCARIYVGRSSRSLQTLKRDCHA